MDILLRLGLALSVFGGLWLALRVVNMRQLVRSADRMAGLEDLREDVRGILYFTTPDCMPCKTVQRPALERLQEFMGDTLQIIEVNAADRTDLADEWGVLSIPTTILIDRTGQPRKINRGVTRFEQLVEQLDQLEVELD